MASSLRALRCALLVCVVAGSTAAACGQTITTVAGNGTGGFSGDAGPATAASLFAPKAVAVDAADNVFIADMFNNRIRRISATTGVITTVAGNGVRGFSGDGGPATSAALFDPVGVAVDGAGNLFIADASNNRIRRVSASSGVITTVAGNGTAGFSGDGGPATSASLSGPTGIAVDHAGNLLVVDASNNRVRRVSASTGIITTVAGNGSLGSSGDDGPATAASLGVTSSDPPSFPVSSMPYCSAVAVDSSGNIFIADVNNKRIRRVSASTGIITTIASTTLYSPHGVALDSAGNVFIADTGSSTIRQVSASSGIMTTVAGNGALGLSGDGGPATAATMYLPETVAVDSAGNLLIADTGNNRVRRVALAPAANGLTQFSPASLNFGSVFVGTSGVSQYLALSNGTASAVIISSITIAGDFLVQAPPSSACSNGLSVPAGTTCYLLVAFAPTASSLRSGTLTLTDSGPGSPHTVALTGTGLTADSRCGPGSTTCAGDQMITTVAGSSTPGFAGDGGPATAAALSQVSGVAVDSSGNLFLADFGNNRVRRVSASTGMITTVAGNGSGGFSGEGGPATSAAVFAPNAVAVDGAGNLFIADANHRIRRVSASSGIITTVAGNGVAGFSGDGGLATLASLNNPHAVAIDSFGSLFIADTFNNRVRRVDASTGIITTVAGNGAQGFGGNGGPATAAPVYPEGVAVDRAGNLFIADWSNNMVRRVSAATGIITTVAGGGFGGLGDGGPATSASFSAVIDVAVASNGDLLIADPISNRIRLVSASTGIITTVVGSGTRGYGGDGGLAADAAMNYPRRLALDDVGNILIADMDNHRVRLVGSAQRMIATASPTSVNTVAAAAAGLRPTCGSESVAHGVWMKYTAPVAGTVSVDLAGSDYQTLVTLWTPTAGVLQQVNCQEAQVRISRSGQRTFLQPKPSYTVGAGQEVWVLITATNGDGGRAMVTPSFVAQDAVPQATFSAVMPHVVSGGGYVTKLSLVNMAATQNNVAVNFVDDQGSVVSSETRMLQPAETMRLATPEAARNGPIATQWASISAQGRIAANLFYEISDQTPQNNIINTVGFNDDAGAQTFTIPVEFQPAPQGASVGRTVGLALSNPNNAQVQVVLTLHDTSGNTRGTSSVTLPPYGHTARALNVDFQSVLPAGNFVGTVTGTAPQAVNVVALGDDFGPFFATPPMTGGTRLIIPHMVTGNAGGAGYVTKLLLVNQAQGANNVTVAYFDQQGNQVNPFNLSTSLTIPANGAVRIATPEAQRFSSTVTVEWALITATSPLGANLFFEIEDQSAQHAVINTIGFNNAPELTDFTLPVELEPGSQAAPVGRTLGVAIANANGLPATVQLTLLNPDGTVLASHTQTINPMAQALVSLNAAFQQVLPNSNFLGALVVHSNVPVAAIALEDDFGPFSAVPVVSGRP